MQNALDDDLIEDTRIYVCDINANMLGVGKKRAEERGKSLYFCSVFFALHGWLDVNLGFLVEKV